MRPPARRAAADTDHARSHQNDAEHGRHRDRTTDAQQYFLHAERDRCCQQDRRELFEQIIDRIQQFAGTDSDTDTNRRHRYVGILQQRDRAVQRARDRERDQGSFQGAVDIGIGRRIEAACPRQRQHHAGQHHNQHARASRQYGSRSVRVDMQHRDHLCGWAPSLARADGTVGEYPSVDRRLPKTSGQGTSQQVRSVDSPLSQGARKRRFFGGLASSKSPQRRRCGDLP